jgi:hypothetical protein
MFSGCTQLRAKAQAALIEGDHEAMAGFSDQEKAASDTP